MNRSARMRLPLGALAASVLIGCGGDASGPGPQLNVKPAWLGTVTQAGYDGVSDDLLTAGLGKTGLAGGPPTTTTPPTATELRRLAIYNNYRALVDVTAGGGYGSLYGPNVTAAGAVTTDEGRIAGVEHIAYADDGSGQQNVTLMVQVPATFSAAAPCIITATSSGSRGIYGAIGTAGEWGLKRGCAVAYTDKGTGSGVHDLAANTVNLQSGVRADAATAARNSNFTAAASDSDRQAFNSNNPNRLAVKHAHSQQNPEKDWGRDTLRAIDFAFYVLNETYGTTDADGRRLRTIVPANTTVIASSVSNGAGAALAAAELDTQGLIDGVAVSEPSVQLAARTDLTIRRGSLTYNGGPRPLYDYFTFANLYQPCAALSSAAADSPFPMTGFNLTAATNRCATLTAAGLLSAPAAQEQANSAMEELLAYGWEPDTVLLHSSHYQFATPAIAMTYSNSYGRFSVLDNLCNLSFAYTSGTAPFGVVAAPASLANIFGTGNGVPPTGGINIVNNAAVGGPANSPVSVSAGSGLADFNFDSAFCQRLLWTSGSPNAQRVRAGIVEAYRSGNLRGKPAIIVQGRSDTLIPANFSSRPYYALNQQVEGAASRTSYIEVTNAQHFDAFLPLPGYDNRFIPLHVYFNRALDAMWAHLKTNAALPPSQVVRTIPRGGSPGAAPPIAAGNVPPISTAPAAGDRITYSNNTLTIPD